MRYICGFILFSLIFFNAFASFIPSRKYSYVTDKQLRSKAIIENILPKSMDDFDVEKYSKQHNTVMLWLGCSRKDRLRTIEGMKEVFTEEGNITFDNPNEFYVDHINAIFYHHLKNKNYDFFTEGNGIGGTFKTLAIISGDYNTNDGRSKIEILKDYLGDDWEYYKEDFSDGIKRLRKMDKVVR